MSSVLWFVGAVALCIGLLVVAHRIEPHWVAKDGKRFLTMPEPVDRFGNAIGRRREVRGVLLQDGGVMLTQRSIIKSASSVWRVQAKSPRPPSGRQLYVLQSVPAAPDGSMLVLRMPAKSRLVPVLDRLAPAAGPGDQRSDT
jgi:hypothetical protein